MTYLTMPNSLVTATTVAGDPLDGNFNAIQTGIMCGSVGFNVATYESTKTMTVAGDVTADVMDVQGVDRGSRQLFILNCITSGTLGGQGDGYLRLFNSGITAAGNGDQFQVPHGGSVTGVGVYFSDLSSVVPGANINLAVMCSGVTVTTTEIDLSYIGWKHTSVITRGVMSFNSGAYFNIYVTSGASGSGRSYLATTVEVVFDE